MRLVLGGVAGFLSLALAACDGSSTPTPSPTPTPTSTPTPTPTPTPTAITYTTSEAGLRYTTEGGVQRVANTTSVAPAMGTLFAFDPAQNGYVYTLLNGTVNPSPSETAVFTPASGKVCDVTPLCFGNGFAFQQIAAAGGGNYYLSRLLAGPGNPLLVLNFTAFGTFEEAFVDNGGGPRMHVDLRPFAYGVTADPTTVPTTGTTTYNGLVIGQATGNKPGATGTSNIYKLTGTFQLVANYAAGTATLKLTLTGDATGCAPTCSPDISVTYDSTAGTIASGVWTFTLPGSGSARFFLAGGQVASGTTAVVPPTEVAGSFMLTAADPNEAGVTMVLAGSGGGFR
jgi:hypothetical protein